MVQNSNEYYELRWKMREFGLASGGASIPLDEIWNYMIDKSEPYPDYADFFSNYGAATHLYRHLIKEPLYNQKDEEELDELRGEYIDVVATHNVLYEDSKICPLLIEALKTTFEKYVTFFEHIEENIGSLLNVPPPVEDITEPLDFDEHPIEPLLRKRDELGYLIIGTRIWQVSEERQYLHVDVDSYEKRMRMPDIRLKVKLLECVMSHYPDYREMNPYVPKDFWWRRIKQHEYNGYRDFWLDRIKQQENGNTGDK